MRITSRINAAWWDNAGFEQVDEEVRARSVGGTALLWAYKGDEQEVLTTVNAGVLDVRSGARLPFGQAIDDEWYTLNGGITWKRWWESGHVIGVQATVGSNSNKPFGASDALVVRGIAFARLPDGDRDGWLLGAQFDNARNGFARNVPVLPLVAYQWQRDDWDILLGVPFIALEWRPHEHWTLAAVGGVSNQAEIEYAPLKAAKFYLRLAQENEQYLRADRPDNDAVLTFSEWRAGAGIRTGAPPTEAGIFTVDVFVGWAFGREIAEFADSDDRGRNDLDPDDALVLTGRFGWLY